jgi:hypothetical protein
MGRVLPRRVVDDNRAGDARAVAGDVIVHDAGDEDVDHHAGADPRA